VLVVISFPGSAEFLGLISTLKQTVSGFWLVRQLLDCACVDIYIDIYIYSPSQRRFLRRTFKRWNPCWWHILKEFEEGRLEGAEGKFSMSSLESLGQDSINYNQL
jgi:hypothetical protein